MKAKMAGKDAKQIDAEEMKAVFDKVLDEQLVAMVDQQVRRTAAGSSRRVELLVSVLSRAPPP